MCQFFSVVSNGKGKIMYFDWALREKCLNKVLSYEPDSHTSIADYFGYRGKKEDVLNKYEYNPLTKKFQVDQLNTKDDSKVVERFCNKLDFKTIVPQLIIKPIIHPFELKPKKVTQKDIQLLKKWVSVRDSVRVSVWASVWAYTSSFFKLPKWKYIDHKEGVNPFQSCIDLWERGFVPSFDEKVWRIHSGQNAKVVFEIAKEKLCLERK